MKAARGFTLIEVVIAITIFALLGFGCYKVVHGLALARDRITKSTEELRQFSKAINIINADFTQLSDRKILDESEKSIAALETHGDYLVEFTRIGVRNPLMTKRSKVVRVAYKFIKDINIENVEFSGDKNLLADILGDGDRGYLVRYIWPVLDRGNDDDPQMQILLSGINGVEIEYFDEDKKWDSEWPPSTSQDNSNLDELPYAIKLKIDTIKYGPIEKLFQVRTLKIATALTP